MLGFQARATTSSFKSFLSLDPPPILTCVYLCVDTCIWRRVQACVEVRGQPVGFGPFHLRLVSQEPNSSYQICCQVPLAAKPSAQPLFFYVYEFYACMYACTLCVCLVPKEFRKGVPDTPGTGVTTTMWVLGPEPQSSARTTSDAEPTLQPFNLFLF